ncbi:Mu transposase C-terminal domain-containing protein [Segnochrobactrum spirostomi]|uniref:Transposase n=1 Tax=Segnochrobactrum spirostomi TaxID=2608987 RepID=A0A6A7Y6I3_9HYPH|nr:DDE-type integrase/transposase/recombinase [Segnochrobactrum spirostomi]MQT13678.1 transposase [Segnochrobactrum spirostomi]
MKARTVTIAQIATTLGVSNDTIARRADKEAWPYQLTSSTGGRPARSFTFTALPRTIQDALDAAELRRLRETFADAVAAEPAPVPADERPLASGPRANARRDARLAIFDAFERLRTASGYSLHRAYAAFSALYAHAALEVKAGRPAPGPEPISSLDRSVFEQVPKLSARTLERIVTTARAGAFQALKGRYPSRRDTGALAIALDPRGDIEGPGAISRAILALITAQPHLSARAVRDQIIGNFGAELLLPSGQLVAMPPVRTFQWHIARLKEQHESTILAVTNPDAWRSKFEFAIGEQDTGAGLNDIWQIDASPADALLVDGRHSVYVLTDLWSRRAMVLVTRTPRAAAVVALLRRAILAWGVPNQVKTDNGSDFKAKATRGVLRSLHIEHPLSPAFTPTDKGHVERLIGTLQHDFMPLQPGFIGHSVADRAAIEARRAFAARLGDNDERAAFCVSLDQVELQRRLDRWCDEAYAHRPHDGLDGQSPWERERSWAGALRTIHDPRALDLLLWDMASGDGYRVVGKKGLRLENTVFWGPGLVEGTRVRVRLDPGDMGRAYVYTAEDDAFICIAESPERLGLDRAEIAARAKADQRDRVKTAKAELRRAKARLRPLHEVAEEVARERMPAAIPFPRASVPHETPALSAAAEAAGSAPAEVARPVEAPRAPAAIIELKPRTESPHERAQREAADRFARWQAIGADIDAGRAVSESDRRWHANYATDSECRAALKAEQLIARGVLFRAPAG